MDINHYLPSYAIDKRHLVKLKDYSQEEIFELLYATRSMKSKFDAHENTAILGGITVALLFGDTSLRTRSALEIGIKQLGAESVDLPYNANDMAAGENITDIVNVISRYGVGALVTRGIENSDLDDYTSVSPLPIINSTNSKAVPMQAISDLYTIWEKKHRIEGLKLAYIGKPTNISRSLIVGAAKCGMAVFVATPKEYELDEEFCKYASSVGNVTFTNDSHLAAKDADVVYTDSYHYHQKSQTTEIHLLEPYKITKSVMGMAMADAIFMHPLPACRDLEVATEVIDGKQSVVYDQAANRLHAIKAILAMLIR